MPQRQGGRRQAALPKQLNTARPFLSFTLPVKVLLARKLALPSAYTTSYSVPTKPQLSMPTKVRLICGLRWNLGIQGCAPGCTKS
jgi:hypothetical protein